MWKVLNLYKPIGLTPLQLIEKFKKENPEYQNEKLGYAGRLDPMAEGVLLILVGEENKKRKEYENLPKEYEFDVLFGIKTDSYDILGKIVGCPPCHAELVLQYIQDPELVERVSASKKDEILKRVQNDIHEYLGKHLQQYPPYSSPRVKGKPLFWWAREGRLSEIEIPKKEIEIYDFKIIKTYKLTSEELKIIIYERISKVKGQFRQEEILKGWEELDSPSRPKLGEERSRNKFGMTNNGVWNDKLNVVRFKISCSSGTYIRSIANELGGIALNIKRVKVGSYSIKNSLRINGI